MPRLGTVLLLEASTPPHAPMPTALHPRLPTHPYLLRLHRDSRMLRKAAGRGGRWVRRGQEEGGVERDPNQKQPPFSSPPLLPLTCIPFTHHPPNTLYTTGKRSSRTIIFSRITMVSPLFGQGLPSPRVPWFDKLPSLNPLLPAPRAPTHTPTHPRTHSPLH